MTIPARMAGAMAGYADAITIRNAQKAIRKELETMLTAYVDAMQAEDPPEARREEVPSKALQGAQVDGAGH